MLLVLSNNGYCASHYIKILRELALSNQRLRGRASNQQPWAAALSRQRGVEAATPVVQHLVNGHFHPLGRHTGKGFSSHASQPSSATVLSLAR